MGRSVGALAVLQVNRLQADQDRLTKIILEVEEYLRKREDVLDGPHGAPRPNWAMEMRREFRGGFNWAKGLR